MGLCKVWDGAAGRNTCRVKVGGVWLVEASCVLVEGEERCVLDGLSAELSEEAGMTMLRVEAWSRRGAAGHC